MVLRRAVNQPNTWAFRRRANVNGERVVVHRAARKMFQMNRPATVKLLILSVVLVRGADRMEYEYRPKSCEAMRLGSKDKTAYFTDE